MASQRGNSTSYHKSVQTERPKIDDPALEGRPALTALKEMWRQSVSRDPLYVAYDRGRTTKFANESINGGDLADALDFLADMTGDHARRSFAAGKSRIKIAFEVCRRLRALDHDQIIVRETGLMQSRLIFGSRGQSSPTRLLHHYGHSGSRKRVSG
jgi:hypothetical protein